MLKENRILSVSDISAELGPKCTACAFRQAAEKVDGKLETPCARAAQMIEAIIAEGDEHANFDDGP